MLCCMPWVPLLHASILNLNSFLVDFQVSIRESTKYRDLLMVSLTVYVICMHGYTWMEPETSLFVVGTLYYLV